MTTKSGSTPTDDEALHVFDQTNGLLGDAAEPAADRRASGGDLPGATNILLGGQ